MIKPAGPNELARFVAATEAHFGCQIRRKAIISSLDAAYGSVNESNVLIASRFAVKTAIYATFWGVNRLGSRTVDKRIGLGCRRLWLSLFRAPSVG